MVNSSDARSRLREIARVAMVNRGFIPDFSSQALAQLDALQTPAAGSTARDLRHLPWCSIDNDDSRDLDQLSVADRSNGEAKILVAIADVDSLVTRDTP